MARKKAKTEDLLRLVRAIDDPKRRAAILNDAGMVLQLIYRGVLATDAIERIVDQSLRSIKETLLAEITEALPEKEQAA